MSDAERSDVESDDLVEVFRSWKWCPDLAKNVKKGEVVAFLGPDEKHNGTYGQVTDAYESIAGPFVLETAPFTMVPQSKWKNPTPAVDLILTCDEGLVFIQRKNPPHGYALAGGFHEDGEAAHVAAKREAREELNVDVRIVEQFHTYTDPKRDPRRHVISTVFIAHTSGKPKAGDDAAGIGIFTEDDLPWSELCFDHAIIMNDYLTYKRTGRRPRL